MIEYNKKFLREWDGMEQTNGFLMTKKKSKKANVHLMKKKYYLLF